MFRQLLPNKNKITTLWRDTYYTKFGSKFWNLNLAQAKAMLCLVPKFGVSKFTVAIL
jgi:hypothetical protein